VSIAPVLVKFHVQNAGQSKNIPIPEKFVWIRLVSVSVIFDTCVVYPSFKLPHILIQAVFGPFSTSTIALISIEINLVESD